MSKTPKRIRFRGAEYRRAEKTDDLPPDADVDEYERELRQRVEEILSPLNPTFDPAVPNLFPSWAWVMPNGLGYLLWLAVGPNASDHWKRFAVWGFTAAELRDEDPISYMHEATDPRVVLRTDSSDEFERFAGNL